jgi:hypothetical protein
MMYTWMREGGLPPKKTEIITMFLLYAVDSKENKEVLKSFNNRAYAYHYLVENFKRIIDGSNFFGKNNGFILMDSNGAYDTHNDCSTVADKKLSNIFHEALYEKNVNSLSGYSLREEPFLCDEDIEKLKLWRAS